MKTETIDSWQLSNGELAIHKTSGPGAGRRPYFVAFYPADGGKPDVFTRLLRQEAEDRAASILKRDTMETA